MTFGRGSAVNSVGVPFFGQNFDLWNEFHADWGSKINYVREVGDIRTSALFMAAYIWVTKGFNAARLTVVQIDSDNKETEIQNHPLVEKFDQPNAFYGGEELWAGVVLSTLADGGAYILKVRNRATGIAELWYEPYWSIRPVWPEDGSEFISGYEINRNGYWKPIEIEDVFVLTPHGMDPDTRRGQSATAALLREHYTDQQAAQFAALLMKQGLVPPLVVSVGDKDRPATEDQARIVKESLMRQMSGSAAGSPTVTSAATNVEMLNYDYGKMGLRDVRAMPEERFCAAMGISPYSLHFGTSRQASTFSNVENYLKQDYRAYIVPLHNYIAKKIAREMLPEFGDTANIRVKWNYDEVPLMQSDQTVEWKRIAEAYKARILDQAEAREAIGYKSDDSHIGIYYPVQSTTTTVNEIDDVASTIVNGFDAQPDQEEALAN